MHRTMARAGFSRIHFDLALVLGGAWLYWRAANRVVAAAGSGKRAAAMSALLIAFFGVLILWLDFTAA
jgi:hypothetical protein